MSFFCMALDTNQEEHKASEIMLKPAGVGRHRFKRKRRKSGFYKFYLPVIVYSNPLEFLGKTPFAYPCCLTALTQSAGQRQTTRFNPPETENIFATSSYDQPDSAQLDLCDSENIQNMSMLNKYLLLNPDEPTKQIILCFCFGETNVLLVKNIFGLRWKVFFNCFPGIEDSNIYRLRSTIIQIDEDQEQKTDYILSGIPLQNCYYPKCCYPEKIINLQKSCITQQAFKCDSRKGIYTEKRYTDEYEHFKQLMKEMHNVKIDFSNSALKDKIWWPSMKKRIKLKEQGKINQYAFYAGVDIKNGNDILFVSKNVEPHHRHRPKSTKTSDYLKSKHSEEIVIEQIDEFLLSNNDKVGVIFIHTYNSPCLSCLNLLLTKAYEWERKYGCFTFVTWTLPWGLKGNIFKRDLTYSEIVSLNSVSYPIDCEGIKFNLNKKKLGGIIQMLNKIVSTAKDKEETKKVIDSLGNELKKQAEKYETRPEHLKNGRQIVESFVNYLPQTSQSQISNILEKWEKVVDSSPLPHSVTEKINLDFKINEVKHVLKFLESLENCPLKLSCVRKKFDCNVYQKN